VLGVLESKEEMEMTEISFDSDSKKEGWVYVGTNSKGERKFRKYTNESLDFVTDYLDSKGLAYMVHEPQALVFIYKEKDPSSEYSSRYSYYYTTGRWGSDKRRKHYHSDGIEHFITKYYKTLEEEKAYWEEQKKDKEE
jgi:hypothetical protein